MRTRILFFFYVAACLGKRKTKGSRRDAGREMELSTEQLLSIVLVTTGCS